MLSPLSSVRPSPPNGEPTQKGKTQNSNSKKNLASPAKKNQRHFTNHNIIVQWQKRGEANQDLETIKVDAKVKCVKEIISPSFGGVSSFVKKIRERETSGKNTNIVHHNWDIIKSREKTVFCGTKMQCFSKAPRKKGTRWKEKVKKICTTTSPIRHRVFYEAYFSRIGFDFPQKKKMQQRQKILYPIGGGGKGENLSDI